MQTESDTCPQLSNHERTQTTPENRSMNTKYIRKRADWRRKYREVCGIIRFLKGDVAHMPCQGNIIVLRSMQETARIMMDDRREIGNVLRITAYPYV